MNGHLVVVLLVASAGSCLAAPSELSQLFSTSLADMEGIIARPEVSSRLVKRQADDDDDDNGGLICNEFRKQEVFSDLDACTSNADQQFIDALGSGTFQRALCNSIEAKIRCWRKHIGRCWNAAGTERITNNYSLDQLERATNKTELLGDDFVRSCPVLRNFQSGFLERAGWTGCTFAEVRVVVREKKACSAAVEQENKNRLAILDFLSTASQKRDHIIETLCIEDVGVRDCIAQLRCTSDAKRAEFVRGLEKTNARIEANLGSKIGFTFSRNCASFY